MNKVSLMKSKKSAIYVKKNLVMMMIMMMMTMTIKRIKK